MHIAAMSMSGCHNWSENHLISQQKSGEFQKKT